MKRLPLLVILAAATSLRPLSAQVHSYEWQNFSSFSWSLGYSAKDEFLPEGYRYAPLAFFGQYQFSNLGPFGIFAEAQAARATEIDGESGDYEAGFNLGLSYKAPLTPNLMITASIGSGPYYVTVETRRQARGFIFSDNFEAGIIYYFTRTRLGVQLRGRYRHISNAGLKSPNGGIDNLFLVAGVSKAF